MAHCLFPVTVVIVAHHVHEIKIPASSKKKTITLICASTQFWCDANDFIIIHTVHAATVTSTTVNVNLIAVEDQRRQLNGMHTQFF